MATVQRPLNSALRESFHLQDRPRKAARPSPDVAAVPAAASTGERNAKPTTFHLNPTAFPLTAIGIVMSVVLFVVFALDLALAWPFKQASLSMDVTFTLCAAALGYLSWNTYRDML